MTSEFMFYWKRSSVKCDFTFNLKKIKVGHKLENVCDLLWENWLNVVWALNKTTCMQVDYHKFQNFTVAVQS